MASGGESKVDTKLFVSTADTVGVVAKDLSACFQEWADDIKNTVEAVQGSAADLLRAMDGCRAALNEMAGIYDKTEKAVQETGKSLKFDKGLR